MVTFYIDFSIFLLSGASFGFVSGNFELPEMPKVGGKFDLFHNVDHRPAFGAFNGVLQVESVVHPDSPDRELYKTRVVMLADVVIESETDARGLSEYVDKVLRLSFVATPQSIILHRASEADIPFLMLAERGVGYERLVGQSSKEQHRASLADTSRVTLVATDRGIGVGFVTCSGLADRHNGVCLQRVVAAVPDKGVGSVLVPAVIDWVFANIATHRIWLDTLRHNTRAQHLYKKLGFTRDGIFREAYQMPDGAYADRILYAMLRREWAALRAAP